MIRIKVLFSTVVLIVFSLLHSFSFAAEHIVNAEVRVFTPVIIHISAGDTVRWTNMTSHNAVSYVAPEGEGFGEHGKLPGGSFSNTFEKEGIYGYACEPHIGFGMVGVVVVGPVSEDDKMKAKQKAMDTLKGPFRRIIGTINKIVVDAK